MNIYVGNLSLQVTEDELRKVFKAFGEVISVTVMNDEYIGSGQSRGYAFVEMPVLSEGKDAVASLQGKNIKGHIIKIVEALPLSDRGSNRTLNIKNSKYSNLKTRQRLNR